MYFAFIGDSGDDNDDVNQKKCLWVHTLLCFCFNASEYRHNQYYTKHSIDGTKKKTGNWNGF